MIKLPRSLMNQAWQRVMVNSVVAFACGVGILCAQPAASPIPGKSIGDSLSVSDLQEAINTLKGNYFQPQALSDEALHRAMLNGILERLAPGAAILSSSRPPEAAQSPLKSEILSPKIGYLRLGSLSRANLAELDSALNSFQGQSVASLILDLRSTPESNDFEVAAEVIRRFCPNGKDLFAIRKAGHNSGSERKFASTQEPAIKGPLVVLMDRENAGASEVIAAALRLHAKSILIGGRTKGEGVEFADFKLGSNKTLRVAIAEVVMPDGGAIYPEGVKPDIAVEIELELKRKVMAKGLEKGVAGLVYETQRPRMNEASLVAGTNPEMDVLQNAQKSAGGNDSLPEGSLRDILLQRAVDLISTIGIYQNNWK